MPDMPEPSEAKRALLEKYLRGEVHQTGTKERAITGPSETAVDNLRERVIAVQKDGSKQPFFYLHGQWDGKFFFCYPLARDLGKDQPFYLLDPYRLEDLQVLPTLEEIAAAHIKSMRAVQPEGPYLLGGWCNGGIVAYEMARQLHAAGQKLDLLLLMDPVTLIYPLHQRLFRHTISHIGKLAGLSQDKQFEWYLWLKQGLKHLYNYLRYSAYRRSKEARVPTAAELRHHYPSNFDWLAMDYKPSTLYPDKITFFWSDTQIFRRGWREVEQRGEVEIHRIRGTHMTSRTDHLPILTEQLRACLNNAQLVMQDS